MSDINTITISGRLTAKPELNVINDEMCKTTFSVACNKYNAKEKKDVATFINCECWNSKAKYLTRFGFKGDMVLITGELKVDNYTNKDNEKKTRTYINASDIVLITKKSDSSETESNGNELIDEDEIPF